MANRTMYDSVTTGDLPKGRALYLGYVDGTYANHRAVKARFPKATVVSVTTGTAAGAVVIDRETGDATATQAARWALDERKAGRTPTIYVSVSQLGDVLRDLKAVGMKVSDFLVYTAHYTGHPHFCSKLCWSRYGIPYTPIVVATQYADPVTSGGHFDLSLVKPYWRGVDPLPKAKPNYRRAYERLLRYIRRHKP